MMYVKLSLRNLKRSIKEYSIYMITMVLAGTLMYSFNCVIFSEQVGSLATRADTFQMMLVLVSILVVVILGWLVYYISNFILQKRSKEFGMYLLMGMTKKQVARMFLLEQLCMGLIAFLIGCFLGVFFYQFLEVIIVNTFHQEYTFSIEFSVNALLCTFVYFIFIYAIELFREQIAIRKMTVYELLYSDKMNEQVKGSKKMSYLLFFLFLVSFLVGLKLLNDELQNMATGGSGGTTQMLASVLMLAVSIYLFFFGISTALRSFMNQQKNLKYRKNMMFLYTQIAGRLRSNRIVLATLSMLTLLTLLFVCLGYKFNEVREISDDKYVPYEVFAYRGGELDMSSVETYLDKHHIGYDDYEFNTYESEKYDEIKKAIKGEPGVYEDELVQYIKESDYRKLRELRSLKPVELKDDQFIIAASDRYVKKLETYAKKYGLQIDEQKLNLKEVNTDEVGQSNISNFLVVIPDEYVMNMEKSIYLYVADTDQPTKAAWYEDTQNQVYEENIDENQEIYTFYRMRGKWQEENAVSFITIAFCLFYLALIFVCIDATILATQQLSDSHKQRYSYQLLWKMGVSRKELHRLLAKQVAVYFLIPLLLPILYVVPLLLILNKLFISTIASDPMWGYLFYSLLFFGTIYGCYFILTYVECRRNIDHF